MLSVTVMFEGGLPPLQRTLKATPVKRPLVLGWGAHSSYRMEPWKKSVEVITFPGEPHSFSFESSPARTPRPAAALKAFRDIASFLQRHLPTLPRPLDPALVQQVPIGD